MELRHLRAFQAVADHEHFGRSAEQLGMAGPPLSRTIRQLEQEIGAPLFTRSTRRVRLTDAGRAFQRDVTTLLQHLDTSVERARRVATGSEGVLRLGATGSVTFDVLPRIAHALQRSLPRVELDVHPEMLTPDQAAALREGRIDLGLLRPPVQAPGIAVHVLHHEPLVLALPTDHRLSGDPAVTLDDLRTEDFITYGPHGGSVVDAAVVRTCARAGFTPRRAHQTWATSTALALVAAGLGIALVPASTRSFAVHGVEFVDLPDTEEVPLALAWRQDDDAPLLRAVLDVLTADLPGPPASA